MMNSTVPVKVGQNVGGGGGRRVRYVVQESTHTYTHTNRHS